MGISSRYLEKDVSLGSFVYWNHYLPGFACIPPYWHGLPAWPDEEWPEPFLSAEIRALIYQEWEKSDV